MDAIRNYRRARN